MNTNHSLISVIIPVYNGQKTLLNTLQSVLKQTYTHFEIIVVDDGSDIPTESLLQPIEDNRIQLYRTERSNANVARNYGIMKSKGEYIAMLDADDYWLDNHLKDCLSFLRESGADGLYGSLFLRNDQSDSIQGRQIAYVRELKEDESMIDYLLTSGYGAQTSTLFATAQSMKDILWNPELIDHQDYDFVVRFHKKYKLIPKSEPTVMYSLSSEYFNHFESCIAFVENNRKDINPVIYKNYNLRMYLQAIQKGASEKFIDYFRKEATRYKEFLSYQQYMSIVNTETPWQKFWAKSAYLFYILQIKVG
jgi:glycosyltransferase involved in cell wall biosynthesis